VDNPTPDTPLTDWLARIQDAERAGDMILAYDHSCQALAQYPGDLQLRYRAVLNLARAGGHGQAETLYREFRLAEADDERISSLGARLLRERALETDQSGLLAEAASRYQAIHQRTAGSFSGVNAAVLWLLVGRLERARELARTVLQQLVADTDTTVSPYYAASDAATAALLLGELETAQAYLQACAKHHGGNQTLLAATRRQLVRVCEAMGVDPALLAPLRPPAVIHYTGHMMAPPNRPGRLPEAAVPAVQTAIRSFLREAGVGHGFGALACGADILMAEALLEHGAELHVVLPCEPAQFVSLSVAPGARDWEARFRRCLARASSLTLATRDRLPGDITLFVYASRLAMGLARLRASGLDAPLKQLAVWDGAPASGPAGTGANVAYWRELGLPSQVIPSGATTRPPPPPPHTVADNQRRIRTLLFGDFRGFGKLRESQLGPFVDGVLGTLARVLDGHGEAVEYRNTWGDGLFVVFREAQQAAHCALDLQRAMADVDLAALGLPENLALRIGIHTGPVMALRDPVLGMENFFGTNVSATARVEPITPPGEVYGTEAFAALLALHPEPGLSAEYVGRMPAAKGFGELRMYRLVRRP